MRNVINYIICLFAGHVWNYDWVKSDYNTGWVKLERCCIHCGKIEVSGNREEKQNWKAWIKRR